MKERASGFVHVEGKKLHFNALLNRLCRYAMGNHFSVAVWRLPSDGKIRLIIDIIRKDTRVKVDLEEIGQGFVFSPFDNLDNSSSSFIQGDIVLSEEGEIVFSARVDYATQTKLLEELAICPQTDATLLPYYSSSNTALETKKEEFTDIVGKAVDSLEEGKFQKVVLSRSKNIKLNASFHLIDTFYGLCEAYPHAFVSLVSTPTVGTWIGASPELLISVDAHKIFKTAAVAGTQLYQTEIPPAEVGWKQKDIEEQAMVSRYIINCFKKIRLREFVEIGPRTSRAGNVVHLKTDFTVDMQAVNFPQLGSVMIELLHPTSAICGMPKDTALDFIEKNENYDRSFYSGYLGPVNMDGESHLYVNIRCMQLQNSHAILYAGAGVTRESVPEKEWEETEIKMNTMLDLLVKMGAGS